MNVKAVATVEKVEAPDKPRVRDRIFETACDLFYKHGIRAVGVDSIANEAGTNKIRYLPDPDGFKKSLLDAKYEHEMEVGGGYAPGAPAAIAPAPVAAAPSEPAGPAALSAEEVDESITRLADLRDRGLITADEFEEKKREILDRL